jgi:hypothetical protein
MATTRKTKAAKASARASRLSEAPAGPAHQDAIALLKADHREVDALFDQFEAADNDDVKAPIAAAICLALKVHAQIEEELFYPPAREETGDTDLLNEAVVEHMGAKTPVAQIEMMSRDSPFMTPRSTCSQSRFATTSRRRKANSSPKSVRPSSISTRSAHSSRPVNPS